MSCDTSDGESFRALAALVPSGAVWIVSSLKRTRETFEAIAEAGGPVSEPLVEPAFAEQNFGRWQGLGWEEMRAANPSAYVAFWQDPVRNAPPEGESFVTVIGRVHGAMDRLTAEFAGRDIVAIGHGGTIRGAVAAALGLTPEAAMAIVVDNLSVTRLSHVQDGLLRTRGGVWLVQGVNMPCRWIR